VDDQLQAWRHPILRWWPFLLGPLATLAYYAVYSVNPESRLIAKWDHEILALALTTTALIIFGIRALFERKSAHIVLTAMTFSLLIREIHWPWTTHGIYCAASAISVWVLFWRKQLWADVSKGQFWKWLVCTGCTYWYGILVMRRAFRGVLPLEEQIHVSLEEVIENTAHLMLVITAFSDKFPGRGRRSSPLQAAHEPTPADKPEGSAAEGSGSCCQTDGCCAADGNE
jgi:hypothetical protein